MSRERSLLLALGLVIASVVLLWAVRQDADDRENEWADLRAGGRIMPAHPSNRGSIRLQSGEYEGAAEDLEEAVQVNPNDAWACNNLAWLRAACPDDRLRNADEALYYATRACDLSHWSNGLILDTLAAAAAEAGRFDEAAAWQRLALEDRMFTMYHARGGYARLALYEDGQPYRIDGND
jgi:serine/threonine-protein kinase